MLGPIAIHFAAPDEGNIHLLDIVARPDQREHWLRPLAAGEIRSCFCMTEPTAAPAPTRHAADDGAADGNDCVINGRKWLITGADGAGFAIIMAKIEGGADGRPRHACSWPTCPIPAIQIERTLDTIDELHRAATRWSVHATCACRPTRCWARSARASATPRCGWRRRG